MTLKPGPKPEYRRVTDLGYIAVWMPDHPDAWKGGRILEHRLVMEQHLGRRLLKTEEVHHKDGNRQNNLIENLEVLTKEKHASIHKKREDNPLRLMPQHEFAKKYKSLGSHKMAEEYGCCQKTVLRIAREYGVYVRGKHRTTVNSESVDKFRRIPTENLRQDYTSLGLLALGRKHGVSAMLVRYVLAERGIPLRKHGKCLAAPRAKSPFASLDTETIRDLASKFPQKELAKMFGVSKANVSQTLLRIGLRGTTAPEPA